jgi:hypothetical protein
MFALAFLAIFIVIAIFYCLSLSRALEKCSPQFRTMQPGMVWLLFIPLFNIIWHFFVVLALSTTLGNEFRARNILAPPEPGKTLGLAMCICAAISIIPLVGIITGTVNLVLWIIYWIKIAEFSRMLDMPAAYGLPPANTPLI